MQKLSSPPVINHVFQILKVEYNFIFHPPSISLKSIVQILLLLSWKPADCKITSLVFDSMKSGLFNCHFGSSKRERRREENP